MKRKVLVESAIETDETGKWCGDDCPGKISKDYCLFFSVQLEFFPVNGLYDRYARCAKCIKAELAKPK